MQKIRTRIGTSPITVIVDREVSVFIGAHPTGSIEARSVGEALDHAMFAAVGATRQARAW